MKKKDLRNLALIGISSGLLVSGQASATATATKPSTNQSSNSSSTTDSKDSESASLDKAKEYDPNDGNLGYHEMTEQELLMELDAEGVKMYNSLTPEGKALARQVASMRCNATNACKGLNACETEHNACAGKGKCKGTGKCAIGDKNLAVKLVRDKMAQKRNDVATPPSQKK